MWCPLLAGMLVICLVAMSALLYPATLPHLFHHSPDHSSGHTSTVCSWLCQMGPGALVEASVHTDVLFTQSLIEPPLADQVVRLLLLSSSSRAPPSQTIG
ncbi:MAG: hypothetical protein U0172_08630 [Nitrospiraceae bacterium]